MKILLISAYRNYEKHIPLGLAYLAGYLEAKNIQTEILDLATFYPWNKEVLDDVIRYGPNDDQTVEILSKYSADIIGVTSNFTAYHQDVCRICKIIKQIWPKSLVVVGGAHASMAEIEVLTESSVDFVVRGEGEITLYELIKSIDSGKTNEVLGISYRDSETGEIKRNDDREEIKDLDSIPLPAWHLLNMNFYFKHQKKSFPLLKNIPAGFVFTSRGSPFNCIFCSTVKNWKRYRSHSPERIILEIEHLIKNYQIRELVILDDNFIWDLLRVEEFCNLLLEKNIRISFSILQGALIQGLSLKILRKLMKVGMYRITLPIESGCEKTLKYIRKPIVLKEVNDLISWCVDLGIWTTGLFVIGFPKETVEDIHQTEKFILNCNLDSIIVGIAQPNVGSDLHGEFLENGLLINNTTSFASVNTDTKYDTLHLNAKQLNKLRAEIEIRFYKKKMIKFFKSGNSFIELIRKFNSKEKIIYGTVLGKQFLKTIIKNIIIKGGIRFL